MLGIILDEQQKALELGLLVALGGLAQQAQQGLGVGIIFAINEDLARRSGPVLSDRAGVGARIGAGDMLGMVGGQAVADGGA